MDAARRLGDGPKALKTAGVLEENDLYVLDYVLDRAGWTTPLRHLFNLAVGDNFSTLWIELREQLN